MATIEITMERSFDAFDDAARERFFVELASITGASLDALRAGTFRRGCVIYSVPLSLEEAIKLMTLVQQRGTSGGAPTDAPTEVELYFKFLNGNDITKIRNVDTDKAIATSKTRAKGPTIVFVHGWSSDPTQAFGKLPELVGKLTGLQTYCYAYPSGKLGSYPNLITIVQHMDNEIAKGTRGSEMLAIIGHSMGGLIARRLLVGQQADTALLGKTVKQLTLMASPSVGSGLAKVADIATLFSNDQLEDLRQDSRFMQDLGPRWTSWQQKNVPGRTKVRAIYGEKDPVVPRSEAALFDATPVPVLGANHSTVVNPRDDELRRELAETLQLFIEQAQLV